jgi:hypothetical protein
MFDLVNEACGGRWLAIAGGGYNPMTLGRIWALQLGSMLREAVPDELPEAWRSAARAALGGEPSDAVRHDDPPSADPARQEAADRQALDTVRAAAPLVGP